MFGSSGKGGGRGGRITMSTSREGDVPSHGSKGGGGVAFLLLYSFKASSSNSFVSTAIAFLALSQLWTSK